jgi:hypothetical protein
VQVLTLLGVIVGALASFLSTKSIERIRWQREQAVNLAMKRLDCYGEFAASIKADIAVIHRLAAENGLPAGALSVEREAGLSMLASARLDVQVKWENVRLYGAPDTIEAARRWRTTVTHLEKFARQILSDPDGWLEAEEMSTRAQDSFYSSARSELLVIGGQATKGLPL